MNKYLIQYSESTWDYYGKNELYISQPPVIRNFTDKQLEDFCKNKKN